MSAPQTTPLDAAPRKPSAQRVQDALAARGFANQVIELPDSTRTAAEAAAAVGCTVGQIAKSLVFVGKQSGRGMLVIASGANRVDEKALQALAGEKIGKADADAVRTLTGFVIGGVPPLGHAQPLQTYIDADLLGHAQIWAAAGHPNAVFALTADELVRMTEGQVAALALAAP
jgi:prolyl-tRNA editing enzyme YbaK/EbsC (Cys-tRNA(Pro) deacylase)